MNKSDPSGFQKSAFPRCRKTCWMMLGLVLLGIGIRLYFFTISTRVLQPSSDESITMLQAYDIAAGGRPLLFLGQPYLFPLESYLIAPVVHRLPSTAFGARLLPMLCHMAAFLVSLLLLWKTTRGTRPWLGLLYVVIPSSYLLMTQSAYSCPGYASLMLGGLLLLLCADAATRTGRGRGYAAAVLYGTGAGILFSSHMLALAFIIPAGLLICFGQAPRRAWPRAAAAAAGLLLGLTPYFLALHRFPHAYGKVTNTFPFAKLFSRLWSPTLTTTLPIGLGFGLSPFPDEPIVGSTPFPGSWLGTAYGILLAGLIVWRVYAFIKRWWKQHYPTLELYDAVFMAAAAALSIFALSQRATSTSYRYLLPAIWAFPFMLAPFLSASRRWIRWAGRGLFLLLILWNIHSSWQLIQLWRSDGFARQYANIADLYPALDALMQNGHTHVVASYGAAYRIGFMSGGAITAAQPLNERFPGWPTPYKDEVDAANDVAYALTETIRFLKPNIFERHMRTMGVEARMQEAGAFRIYDQFRLIDPFAHGPWLELTGATLHATHGMETLHGLIDGNLSVPWKTKDTQEIGMYFTIQWDVPVRINRVSLFYGSVVLYHAQEVEIEVWMDDAWHPAAESPPFETEKFTFINNHPVYAREEAPQTIWFEPREAQGIRVTIKRPTKGRPWEVRECRVGLPAQP